MASRKNPGDVSSVDGFRFLWSVQPVNGILMVRSRVESLVLTAKSRCWWLEDLLAAFRRKNRSYRAEIDLDQVGLKIQASSELRLAAATWKEQCGRFAPFAKCPSVTVRRGGDCFVLKIAVADIKELQRFLDRIAAFGDLTTSVILSTPCSTS